MSRTLCSLCDFRRFCLFFSHQYLQGPPPCRENNASFGDSLSLLEPGSTGDTIFSTGLRNSFLTTSALALLGTLIYNSDLTDDWLTVTHKTMPWLEVSILLPCHCAVYFNIAPNSQACSVLSHCFLFKARDFSFSWEQARQIVKQCTHCRSVHKASGQTDSIPAVTLVHFATFLLNII